MGCCACPDDTCTAASGALCPDGCTLSTGSECVAGFAVVSSSEIGTLPYPNHVWGRDGAFSVGLAGDRIRWWFGDGLLDDMPPDGVSFRPHTGPTAPRAHPTALTYEYDAAGFPVSWVPLLPAERVSYVAAGVRVLPYNSSAVTLPDGRHALFFVKVQDVPTYEAFGTGVALSGDDDPVAARTEPVFSAAEVADSGGAGYVAGALLLDDYVYLYAPKQLFSEGTWEMRLARVPWQEVTSRPAYEFWDGAGWTANIASAVPVLVGASGGPQVSVVWNAYLNQFLMVYGGFNWRGSGFDLTIGRAAPQPWGPWGAEVKLYDNLPHTGTGDYAFNYWQVEHPALQRDNGRVITTSYFHNLDPLPASQVRLVQVTLDRAASACVGDTPLHTPTATLTPTLHVAPSTATRLPTFTPRPSRTPTPTPTDTPTLTPTAVEEAEPTPVAVPTLAADDANDEGAMFVLALARLQASRGRLRGPDGRIVLRGDISAAAVSRMADARRANVRRTDGLQLAIQGAGLPAAEVMRFPAFRCLVFGARRTYCIGDDGETADILCVPMQRSCSVRIAGRNRRFRPPLQAEPLQVDLTVGTDATTDRVGRCRVFSKKLVSCRK